MDTHQGSKPGVEGHISAMSTDKRVKDDWTVKAGCCCPTLMDAAKSSHPKCIDWILSHGRGAQELFRRQNLRLPKPLHEAAGAKPEPDGNEAGMKPSCTACVEALLAAGADAACPDEGGRSPLQRAAMMGCVPCIEILLRSPQTKVDAVCDFNSTALVEAIRINSVPAVRALVAPPRCASVRPELSGSYQMPVTEALTRGSHECIAPLVEAGALLNPSRHPDGCWPLSPLWAVIDGRVSEESKKGDEAPELLRWLVKLGADVNARGPWDVCALSYSASEGLCESMRVLLELGADPVLLSRDGESPLHNAASSSEARACQLLVEHIIEVSGSAAATAALLAQDGQGKNPLHWAVTNSYRSGAVGPKVASCMSALLLSLREVGGAQAVDSALRETVGGKEWTLAHFAAKEKIHECLEVLSQTAEGARVILEVVDKGGLTPVALARLAGLALETIPAFANLTFPPCCRGISESIKNGHVSCLRRSLRRVRETAKTVTGPGRETIAGASTGRSSSYSASEISHGGEGDPLASVIHKHDRFGTCSKMVRLLLDAGFSPNGCRADDAPLRHSTDAANFGDNFCTPCTRQLVDAGARGFFTYEDGDFRTCAMDNILFTVAMDPTQDDALRELVRIVLSVCNVAEDALGVTKLYRWAGGNEEYFDVEKGLVEAGVDILAKDDVGRTSLHMLAGMLNYGGGHESENDGDDLGGGEDADDDGEPLRDGLAGAVNWLVSKGAIACMDAQDDNGNTPLHVATRKGFGEVVEKLLALGADPCLQNTAGDNALHVAAARGDGVTVARLVDAGVGVDTRSNRGFTALLNAANRSDLDTVAVLLDGGASCSIPNDAGTTPLLAAAARGHIAICSLLVARGGRGDVVDNAGKTPLSAALEAGGDPRHRAGREAVVKLLIGHGCPVGATEIHAASRGRLTQAFGEAITARMNSGASAQRLSLDTTFRSILPPGAGEAVSGGATRPSHNKRAAHEPALDEERGVQPSMVAVRLRSRQNPDRPITCSAQQPVSGADSATSPLERDAPSTVYRLDSVWLRWAVAHLEGTDEADNCVLLRLLLPSSPEGGWAASYGRTGPAVSEGRSPDQSPDQSLEGSSVKSSVGAMAASVHAGSAPEEQRVGVSPRLRTPKPFVAHTVDLLCDGDDFDRAGFESVMEYLATGQVFGATCGSIHGGGDASGFGSDASVGVGTRAAATHRAAAFFGLPRLQRMVRDWLAVNGAEMEDDDGTAVLSTTETRGAPSGHGKGKRKHSFDRRAA